MALSPDASTLAIACGDGVVRLVDPLDGSITRVIAAHDDSVAAIAWVPGTSYLATAGYDGRVRLWDAATGWLLRTFTEGPGALRSIAVSPDGAVLVAGSASGALTAWEARTGREVKWWSGHSGMVSALAFSPDGTQLVSASSDRVVRLWSTRDWTRVREWRPNRAGVNALAFPDPLHVITGADNFEPGRNGIPRALDVPTLSLVAVRGASVEPLFPALREWVLSVAVIPGTGLILVGTGGAAGDSDPAPPGRALVLDRGSGRTIAVFELAARGVTGVVPLGSGAIGFGGLDGWVRRVELPAAPAH